MQLLTIVFVFFAFISLVAKAQQVVKEKAYQLLVPAGWEQTKNVPQGVEVGFRKRLPTGEYATCFFHHEVMPAEAGAPPSDTSGMKVQWDSMIRNKYPDMRPVNSEVPQVNGKILINASYDLTDGGEKVRRRYTYFLSDRTAFIVQCSTPPTQWATALGDFDKIVSSLKPGSEKSQIAPKSDQAAVADLKRLLPTLVHSFPSQWACSLNDVGITPNSARAKRTMEIKIAFNRSDAKDIYNATKSLFGMIKQGKTDAELNSSIPAGLQSAASNSGEFIKYIGQDWGAASGYVAGCNPVIEYYTVAIVDPGGKRIGSVTVSRDDASAILSGKVTPADGRRIAGMYQFE